MADSEEKTDEGTTDETEEQTQNPPDDQRDGDGQDYIDRSTIDFDPDDGLLSGTAVDGTSDIPGPHEDESGEVDAEGAAAEPDDSDDSDDSERDDDRPLPHPH